MWRDMDLQGRMRELDILVARLDSERETDSVRRSIGDFVVSFLNDRRDKLSNWEKMQIDLALDLLPTKWLRLCCAHLDLAFNDRERANLLDPMQAAKYEAVTWESLVMKLGEGFTSFEARQRNTQLPTTR